MSLGAFLTDEKMGSWADEMEDMPVSDSRTGYGGGASRGTYSSSTGAYGGSGGYSVREELPLPDKPPYTVHLGNLSFDATVGDVTDFFAGCECTNVRIIEDKQEMKPKGFGYAEFATLEGLKSALLLNGTSFQTRNIRISVADPPKDRDRPDAKEFGDWSRKGPLPDIPGRGGSDRRGSDRGGFGGDFGGERKERTPYAGAEGDGKVRDFSNWERRGPLSPLPQQERAPRDGGRPGTNDGPKGEGFRDRRASPAAWGEGRPQDSTDGGSRPPRREFQERPAAERTPTAAEQDSQWRTKMKPDAPTTKSPIPSRDGSEAPSSPAPGSAVPAPMTRPRLNLAKRTVTDAPDQPSPTTSVSGSKPNPFGGASAVDTAARERAVEEARAAAAAEKKESEEKAKAERAEAAKTKAAEDELAKNVEGEKKIEILQRPEGAESVKSSDDASQNGTAAEKPKELTSRPKPVETGAWRRPAQGPPGPRDDHGPPRGPRGGSRGRGGRGDGPGRGGPRNFDEGRGGRQNSNGRISSPTVSSPVVEADPDAPADDGWNTVVKPKKNVRGGR